MLSIVMLASSMGVTLATHYCDGQAVESRLSLGIGALKCGMEDMDNTCPNEKDSKQTHIETKSCCENQYETIDSDDTLITKFAHRAVDLHFFIAFINTYFSLAPAQSGFTTSYLSYSPPSPEQDVQVLYQAFLL